MIPESEKGKRAATATVAEIAESLRSRAPDLLESTRTPGAVVSLADKSGEVIDLAFGEVAGVALTPEHVMNVGSVAKIYVSVMVMVLRERDLIDLDAPAATYLPFGLFNPLGGPRITVRHLLTHTSGLCTDTFDAVWSRDADYHELELAGGRAHEYGGERFRWAGRTGETYIYSSFGVGLAGLVVATVMGKPFGECVEETILGPLGMHATAWPDAQKWPALMERRVPGELRVGGTVFTSPSIESSNPQAIELVTRPGDHLKLLVTLWNGGEAYDVRLLEPLSVDALMAPQVPNLLFGLDLGEMGLCVQFRNRGQVDHYWGHGGGFPFQGWTESRVYPNLGLAVAACDRSWQGFRHIDPPDSIFVGVACEWAARWMRAGAVPPQRPLLGQTWSYALGLLVAERFVGSLGMGAIPESALHGLIASRVSEPGTERTDQPWDEAQFRQAVNAVERTGGRPEAIRGLLDDPDTPVGPEEMEMFALRWGAPTARNPLLIRALADLSGMDERYRHIGTAAAS